MGLVPNSKPMIRDDVYNDMAKLGEEDITKFATPNTTVQSTLDRFFLQPEPVEFTGNPQVLCAAAEVTKQQLYPVFRKARTFGIYKLSNFQNSLNKQSTPGFIIKKLLKCLTKEQALNSDKARQYIREFMEGLYTPIFTVKDKYEVLPVEKARAGQVRTFEVAPLEYLITLGIYIQPIIDALLLGQENSAYGVVLQHGGFKKVMDSVTPEKGEIAYAGDVEKWDKFQEAFLMMFSYLIVEDVWDDPHYRLVLAWALYNELYSVFLLPDGRLVRRKRACGFNSGTVGTTFFNIIKHIMIRNYHLIYWKSKSLYISDLLSVPIETWTVGEVFKCFADDHVGKGSPQLNTYEKRVITYSHFGMRLKKEEDFYSTSVQGMKFLGFINCNGVPIFDMYRILTGLWLMKEENSDVADISQMVAMVMLASTNETMYRGKRFCDYVHDIANQYLFKTYGVERLKQVVGNFVSDVELKPVSFFAQIWTHDLPRRVAEPEGFRSVFPSEPPL